MGLRRMVACFLVVGLGKMMKNLIRMKVTKRKKLAVTREFPKKRINNRNLIVLLEKSIPKNRKNK